MLAQAEAKTRPTMVVADGKAGDTWVQPATQAGGMAASHAPFTYSTPEQVKVARTVLEQVLPQISKQVRSIHDLNDPKIVEKITEAAMTINAQDEGLFASVTKEQAVAVVAELCKNFVERTLAIPALTITPQQQVTFGFRRFDLDMKSWNFQPLSRQLSVQELRTGKSSVISAEDEGEMASRLEDYLVVRLIDYSEIDYDSHADILYDLAGQAVAQTRQRFSGDDDQALSVLRGLTKAMADSIFSQMKQNMWREQTNYRVSLASAFGELRPQTFDTAGTGFIRDFKTPPDQKQDIRKYVFTGFARGCYQYAKFDSDPERRLVVVLEKEQSVRLWMKPGPNQFKIFDATGAPYQPDFVVETETEKLIIEVKRLSEMNAAEVLRKADAACLWCHIATKASAADGEKPWSYLLVPETDVQENFTVSGLIAKHTRSPDADLLSRYQFDEESSG
jgi:type III restriction enzyme